MKNTFRRNSAHYHLMVTPEMKEYMWKIAESEDINWQREFRTFIRQKIDDYKRQRQA